MSWLTGDAFLVFSGAAFGSLKFYTLNFTPKICGHKKSVKKLHTP